MAPEKGGEKSRRRREQEGQKATSALDCRGMERKRMQGETSSLLILERGKGAKGTDLNQENEESKPVTRMGTWEGEFP